MKKRVVFILIMLVICSCATQRISQFASLAAAGKSYSEAMSALTEETGKIAIDADNEHLLLYRDKYTEEDRKRIILERDSALRSLLDILGGIRVHTALLGRYFESLNQLAGSKYPSTLTGQIASLVESLEKIHPVLENATIGNMDVKSFIGEGVPVILGSLKQKKLEQELRRNAAMVERELELQKALLEALSEQLKSDLELLLQIKNFNQVLQPYIKQGQPGKEWKSSRKEVLTTSLSLAALDQALSAATELKTVFLNLTENKATLSGFKSLFDSINLMIGLVEKIQGTNGK
jgi:hypothetical protein